VIFSWLGLLRFLILRPSRCSGKQMCTSQFTRNFLTFVNATAIAYGRKIDQSLRILVACNSSRFYKRQKIASTRPETQPSQAHHGCSRSDRSIALDASTCCSREMSAHGPTDQLISALEESLVLSRTQGKDLPSIQQLSSSIHLNQQCPQNHPNNHPHKARRRITNPSSPRPPRVQNS